MVDRKDLIPLTPVRKRCPFVTSDVSEVAKFLLSPHHDAHKFSKLTRWRMHLIEAIAKAHQGEAVLIACGPEREEHTRNEILEILGPCEWPLTLRLMTGVETDE